MKFREFHQRYIKEKTLLDNQAKSSLSVASDLLKQAKEIEPLISRLNDAIHFLAIEKVRKSITNL